MKSPRELAARLAAQWRRPALRLARLGSPSAWPLRLPIGRPPPARLVLDLDAVRAHVHAWSAVATGEVEWENLPYRGAGQAIRIPLYWKLPRPSDWIAGCADPAIAAEYALLSRLCAGTPSVFHSVWIGKPHLWRDHDADTILRAARLADQLAPGCAGGRPLRALSLAGVDSKFHEVHRALLLALLDTRHHGAASELGLEDFLGAAREDDHWVLLADLDGGLLPFVRQRVRTAELAALTRIPGTHVLIVENERCLHQLPPLPGTLALLGAGLDLGWIAAPCLGKKHLAYWGDLDTWGLRMLGLARSMRPELRALLMDRDTFDLHAPARAVPEPEPAEPPPPGTLSTDEFALFTTLAASPRGRLEQEFLPMPIVHAAVSSWRAQPGRLRDDRQSPPR